ncbi:hypothetical protein C7M84_004631 [Penaeus vannamei]|uniref:Uncharacterized protein n=1 Tax=Penaeus vannamei TaxID=6689 RepID=A0A423TK15_PENVA|nr:hypothetical protein C7M84_004631 [Penaeus vannamei]
MFKVNFAPSLAIKASVPERVSRPIIPTPEEFPIPRVGRIFYPNSFPRSCKVKFEAARRDARLTSRLTPPGSKDRGPCVLAGRPRGRARRLWGCERGGGSPSSPALPPAHHAHSHLPLTCSLLPPSIPPPSRHSPSIFPSSSLRSPLHHLPSQSFPPPSPILFPLPPIFSPPFHHLPPPLPSPLQHIPSPSSLILSPTVPLPLLLPPSPNFSPSLPTSLPSFLPPPLSLHFSPPPSLISPPPFSPPQFLPPPLPSILSFPLPSLLFLPPPSPILSLPPFSPPPSPPLFPLSFPPLPPLSLYPSPPLPPPLFPILSPPLISPPPSPLSPPLSSPSFPIPSLLPLLPPSPSILSPPLIPPPPPSPSLYPSPSPNFSPPPPPLFPLSFPLPHSPPLPPHQHLPDPPPTFHRPTPSRSSYLCGLYSYLPGLARSLRLPAWLTTYEGMRPVRRSVLVRLRGRLSSGGTLSGRLRARPAAPSCFGLGRRISLFFVLFPSHGIYPSLCSVPSVRSQTIVLCGGEMRSLGCAAEEGAESSSWT